MPPTGPRLTASSLPSEMVTEHRVMFLRSHSSTKMTVVTDTMRDGLAELLTKQLGFTVLVEHIVECGDTEAQAAYPRIMAQCTGVQASVRDVLATQSGEDQNPDVSPKKLATRKRA